MPGEPAPLQIDLGWEEPADRGGSAVTGYRIEWSADGTHELARAGRGHRLDGQGLDRDTDLPSETTRHYRVSAINAAKAPARPRTSTDATSDDLVPPVLVEAQV